MAQFKKKRKRKRDTKRVARIVAFVIIFSFAVVYFTSGWLSRSFEKRTATATPT